MATLLCVNPSRFRVVSATAQTGDSTLVKFAVSDVVDKDTYTTAVSVSVTFEQIMTSAFWAFDSTGMFI